MLSVSSRCTRPLHPYPYTSNACSHFCVCAHLQTQHKTSPICRQTHPSSQLFSLPLPPLSPLSPVASNHICHLKKKKKHSFSARCFPLAIGVSFLFPTKVRKELRTPAVFTASPSTPPPSSTHCHLPSAHATSQGTNDFLGVQANTHLPALLLITLLPQPSLPGRLVLLAIQDNDQAPFLPFSLWLSLFIFLSLSLRLSLASSFPLSLRGLVVDFFLFLKRFLFI